MTRNCQRACQARTKKYGTIIWKRVYIPRIKNDKKRRKIFDEIEEAYHHAILKKLNGEADNFLDIK